jgi:hypothetical protein
MRQANTILQIKQDKGKTIKTVPDLNSGLAKSMTQHNQTKELVTWFLKTGKELSNYLIVPILGKGHDFFQVFSLTSSYNLIKDPVIFFLHAVPVNPLGESYPLVLRNDNRLIEVLLECRVKPVINPNLLLNKSQIFLLLSSSQSIGRELSACSQE